MTVDLLREFGKGPPMVVPLTVDQYHQMISQGILAEGQPIELLDGLLIRKDRSKAGENPMTVGHHHAWAVDQLAQLNERFSSYGCFIRTQQPVSLKPDSEPEPDASILRGNSSDFRDRHPTSVDVLCVIEVADSSLNHDRTTKQRIYAESGITRFIIINLIDRVIEIYKNPDGEAGRYASVETLKPGETLDLPTTGAVFIDVAVSKLLP